MTIHKAIEHLSYRMKSPYLKPTSLDIEAMNTIITYFNQTKVQRVDDNRLFVKLFTHLLIAYMWQYKDASYQFCVDKIIDLLAKPLDDYLSEARRVINAKEYLAVCKSAGVTLVEHQEFLTMQDFATYYKNNQEQFQKNEQTIKKSLAKHSQAGVNNLIIDLVSDMLLFYSEHP